MIYVSLCSGVSADWGRDSGFATWPVDCFPSLSFAFLSAARVGLAPDCVECCGAGERLPNGPATSTETGKLNQRETTTPPKTCREYKRYLRSVVPRLKSKAPAKRSLLVSVETMTFRGYSQDTPNTTGNQFP